MTTFLWLLAILLSIVAGIAGLFFLFFILSLVVKAAANAAEFSNAALLQLILTTILDIRFLALVDIIFTIMAGYEGGGWQWLGLILSFSLFLMSASYIVIFLLELIDYSIFSKLETVEKLSDDDKKFWEAMMKIVHINIGFLGILYIFLAFYFVSYNYFLISYKSLYYVFTGPRTVTSGDFAMYAFQTVINAIPFDFSKKFNLDSLANIRVRDDAYLFNAFVMSFQALFYGAFAEFVWWFIKTKKR